MDGSRCGGLEALPLDVWPLIGLHLSSVAELDGALSCSRRRRDAAHGHEPIYADLARLRWGADFWRRALSRPTRRVFVSMRRELQQMDRLDARMRSFGLPPWTLREYEAFWAMEARYFHGVGASGEKK